MGIISVDFSLANAAQPTRGEQDVRSTYAAALALDGEPLLGAIPLEDLDLHVDPQPMRLIANPESPDRPMSLVVGVLPVSRDKDA